MVQDNSKVICVTMFYVKQKLSLSPLLTVKKKRTIFNLHHHSRARLKAPI